MVQERRAREAWGSRVCNFRSKFCLLFCGCGIRWGGVGGNLRHWEWSRVKVKLVCTWQPPPWLPSLPLFPPQPHALDRICLIKCRKLLDLIRKKCEQPICAHQLGFLLRQLNLYSQTATVWILPAPSPSSLRRLMEFGVSSASPRCCPSHSFLS